MPQSMHVSAQISLYPLRQEHLSPAIKKIAHVFEEAGLHPQVGPMSTVIEGDSDAVFSSLQKAFVEASNTGQVVLNVTISNACPTTCRVE